jgi:hypothetical protein
MASDLGIAGGGSCGAIWLALVLILSKSVSTSVCSTERLQHGSMRDQLQ